MMPFPGINLKGRESILTYAHIIYIKVESKPIFQPQHWMKLTLKEIFKEELQKFLTSNLIYSISDSQWVSPLVMVSKKEVNGECLSTIENLIKKHIKATYHHLLLTRSWIC
jgi:hypothetical protein